MQSIIQARLQKSSEQSEVYSGGQSSPLKVTNAAKFKGNQRKRGKRIIETDCLLMKEILPKGRAMYLEGIIYAKTLRFLVPFSFLRL